MECPRCTSTEFTKLSLLYEQGSSTFQSRSGGLGLAIGTGADLVLGQARTKGEIQTRLSNKVSPPRKWSYWKTVVSGLIGLLVLEFSLGYAHTFLGYAGNFNQQLSWIGWSYFGFLVFLLGLAVWCNSRVFPKKYHAWDRSFMCRRCGHIVEVERSAPSQPHLAQEVRL
jgi:hypothetical protein